MLISATVTNRYQSHEVVVTTNANSRTVTIPGKPTGYGSAVNGGELLFLALATCFCNDVYREATKRQMHIQAVEVTVSGEFGQEGEPATSITYQAHIQAPEHTPQEIADLVSYVDQIAEIHNTLRQGIAVTLQS
ncbi:OsmC family protein [Adhaeribacter swui]|uniref:OsmC family protein n=1 Tax=Adhaeribacter swui TaxID=2086471 RepID=A0A7G7GF43_9BACT|nr:OsmC family protein [Adhaeribacter swui]QNF35777.1 OsmC family protein [Adhaeribacter swui]